MASATFADTTLHTPDVGVVGDANASPGAVLTRGGSTTFNLTVTANDGNIPASQCAHGWVTVPNSFTLTSAGLVAGASTTTTSFPCNQNFSGSAGTPATLTFSNIALQADATAPLGASNYAITFGRTGTMVTFGTQVKLDDDSTPFVAPRVYVTINPRPVTNLDAEKNSVSPTSAIDVSWTEGDSGSGITHLVTRDPAFATSPRVELSGSTGFTDSGLSDNTQYCYSVVTRFTDSNNATFDSTTAGPECATTDQIIVTNPTVYTIEGFYQPVENKNIMKGGAAVPLKFNILADGVKDTSGDASLIDVFVLWTSCTETTGETNLITDGETVATNKSELKWNGDQWVFNWKSPKVSTETCYKVMLTLDGGDSVEAQFNLRK